MPRKSRFDTKRLAMLMGTNKTRPIQKIDKQAFLHNSKKQLTRHFQNKLRPFDQSNIKSQQCQDSYRENDEPQRQQEHQKTDKLESITFHIFQDEQMFFDPESLLEGMAPVYDSFIEDEGQSLGQIQYDMKRSIRILFEGLRDKKKEKRKNEAMRESLPKLSQQFLQKVEPQCVS